MKPPTRKETEYVLHFMWKMGIITQKEQIDLLMKMYPYVK